MAPHSSTLAWKIPWTEEPGGLQSIALRGVGHDWATSLSLFTFLHWRRKWQPTPMFLPGESQGRWSLVGCCLWGHAESDTTERLSSSSSSSRFNLSMLLLMMVLAISCLSQSCEDMPLISPFSIILFHLFLAVLGLCCHAGFSPVSASGGATLHCGAHVSHCGFSCCRAWALRCTGFSSYS